MAAASAALVPIVDRLIPGELMKEIREGIATKDHVYAIATLVCKLIRGAAEALKMGHYSAFDANAGDMQCQNQALYIRRLVVEPGVREELERLSERAKDVLEKKMNLWKRDGRAEPRLFLEGEIRCMGISTGGLYLVFGHLLYIVRRKGEPSSDGVCEFKTDAEALQRLSRGVPSGGPIVGRAQSIVSKMTADALGLSCRKELGAERYPKKTFVELFPAMALVMSRLRRDSALICVRSTPRGGMPPFHVFLRSGVDGSFKPAPRGEPDEPVVVFEMVVRVAEEVARRKLADGGFERMVLADAAACPQFDRGSDPVPGAVRLSEDMILDHVYVASVKEEVS